MLAINRNKIDLWMAFPKEIQDEGLLEKYRCLLTAEELQQGRSFYFPKDRHRHLITRTLVRTVLSRYAPIPPDLWVFSKGKYGKPAIDKKCCDKNISFNVSHTDDLIVLGVTEESALGVDTENACHRKAPLEVAERFFSPLEVADLFERDPAEQQDVFFQYWTLKEAYIKARGKGLQIPLDQFTFHLKDSANIDVLFHSALDDDSERWRFWQFRPTQEHIVSICALRSLSSAQQIEVRKIVPFRDEQILPFQKICMSL